MNICCVFVCNKKYFKKFSETCKQLIENGKYKGDICLVIDNDLIGNDLLNSSIIKNNNIIIKKFDKIAIPKKKYLNASYPYKVDGCSLKFNLFKTYFKKWNYIFYLDCGMIILNDITPLLNEAKKNKLLAHSDAYPKYKWKLKGQFTNDIKLNRKYNLNIDYFQSGIMLFDTSIITNKTFTEIIKLLNKYPTGRTNDQCYLSLYFIIIKPCWEQLKLRNENTNFYDYLCRNKNDTNYLIVKVKNW